MRTFFAGLVALGAERQGIGRSAVNQEPQRPQEESRPTKLRPVTSSIGI